MLLTRGSELIFICEADRSAWVQGMRGKVIYNFVDFNDLREFRSQEECKLHFGIPPDNPVILYVGGLRPPKGIFPLLESLALVKRKYPNVRCLMPDSLCPAARSMSLKIARSVLPVLGSGTNAQKAESLIVSLGLEDVCIRYPASPDLRHFFVAADVLVFPATVPHFARPVIEASAMSRPSVASGFPVMRELIIEGETGLITKPDDPTALADALLHILDHPEGARAMGVRGRERAMQMFSATANGAAIMKAYDSVLAQRNPKAAMAHA